MPPGAQARTARMHWIGSPEVSGARAHKRTNMHPRMIFIVFLDVSMILYVFIHPSIHPTIHPSIHLSVYLKKSVLISLKNLNRAVIAMFDSSSSTPCFAKEWRA